MICVDVDVAVVVPVNLMPLTDDTDFKTRETAVAYNAAGMDLVWNFVSSAGVVTQTAVTPTTAGVYDWAHAGDGMYTMEIPASGGASINNDTEGYGYFTGICTGVLAWRGPTICFRAAGLNDALVDSAYSTTRGLAGTALPNAAAEAAGGLYTRGTGAGQINQDANGRVDVSLKAILGTTLTETAGQIAAAFKKFFDKASPTGTINSIPDAVAGANGGLGTVDASNRVAGIQGTTKHTLDDLNDLSGTSIASAVWNALTSGMSTVGSIGKRIVDYLTGDVYARVGAPAGASLAADVAAVKTVDDAIKLKTDNLPSDPADESLVIAATDAIYNRLGAPAGASVSADVAAVKSDTAAILVDTGTTLDGRIPAALTADGNMKADALRINGNANAAARLALSAAEIKPGTVDATAFTPTTTEFESDDITTAAPDFWNGAIVLFTSGALQGQKTTVSDYSAVGGRGHFTVVAVTSAPADNVTFVLI